MFGVLGSLAAADLAPAIEGATVLDLFAGSGALGLEALSRGAARAVFVDSDRDAVATVKRNLSDLGYAGSRAQVVRSDASRWLRTAPPVDLALCDPPYRFDGWTEVAGLLLPLTQLAVLEAAGPPELGPEWEVLREKQYGGTVVVVARPARLPEPAHDRKGDT
jgi:16S rRNA (guanine966-N2)-methyltransferase